VRGLLDDLGRRGRVVGQILNNRRDTHNGMSREPVMDNKADGVTEDANGDERRQHGQPPAIGLARVHRRIVPSPQKRTTLTRIDYQSVRSTSLVRGSLVG
jgi:hypothetical protein